jgi:hypothetical protein
MFRYRVLLVDTATCRERPLQAHFMSLFSAEQWARQTLKNASNGAEVVFYAVKETEMGVMTRDDTGTIQSLQPAGRQAG